MSQNSPKTDLPKEMDNFNPSAVLKKEELRTLLDNQVEKFLKNGGTIQELPIGFTHFKDGIIPVDQKAIHHLRKKQNEEKNTKPSVVNKPELVKKTIQPKPKKVAAPKPVKPKREPKRKKPIQSFSNEELQRRKNITEERRKAEAKGLNYFTAVCKVHGQTKYLICSNGTRCALCLDVKSKSRSERRHDDAERKQKFRARVQFNREALKKAIALNKNTFMGQCVNCGVSEFKIQVKNNSKESAAPKMFYHPICIACNQKNMKTYEENRKLKRQQLADKKAA